ncbi:MAG: response regulator, partial [Pseudomonadota bacterium]|nr:response regulator [Pseudomonadota bacterium]
ALALLGWAAQLLRAARARLIDSETEQRVLFNQLRASLDSVTQGIGVFDGEHRLVRWNTCFPVLLNLPRGIPPADLPYAALAERLAEAAEGGAPLLEPEDLLRHADFTGAGDPVAYDRTRAADQRAFEFPMPSGGFVLTSMPRGNATVLLVEDEPAVREVAGTVLRELGYRVLEASNGPEALRVFAEHGAAADLALLDVILPSGMNGQELAGRLAELRPELRVVFMSGSSDSAPTGGDPVGDGAHLLAKPFQREQLARKVAEVLGTLDSGAPRQPGNNNVVALAGRERRADGHSAHN